MADRQQKPQETNTAEGCIRMSNKELEIIYNEPKIKTKSLKRKE